MVAGTDTIFALATAPGRAGVGIVRLSGPAAMRAVASLVAPAALPSPRVAGLRGVRDPVSGELLDRALILQFPGPHSYTGEDVVELQVHGGIAVATAVLGCLATVDGLRPAEAGEFSRRAVLNGRLDLTQAEAIADLVASESAAQRRQALRQLDGALGDLYEGWRVRLLSLLARIEAEIDFPDEDLPGGMTAAAAAPIGDLAGEITAHLRDGRRGERLRDGYYVVILGAPNVGKSSLLNWLAQRDAAIVSAVAGTTRDVIEVHLELGGYPVIVADTAGLRESGDEIETEGVRRATARAAEADLTLIVGDARDDAIPTAVQAAAGPSALSVLNKADLAPGARAVDGLLVSAKTGAGLETLLDRLTDAAASGLGAGEAPVLTRARHRQALEACVARLEAAVVCEADELLAEEVRLAGRALGRVTGRVDVEDLLDVVFADFCIGK